MRCTSAMSYARARLWLGITGVGTMVVVSFLLLLLGAPWRLLPTTPGTLPRDLTALAWVFIVYAALSAPFDLFGGWVLPTEFRRSSRSFGEFFAVWLRGVVFHGAFLLASATVLLIVARKWGFVGAVGAFVVVQVALLLCQPLVAGLLGGLRFGPRERKVAFVETDAPYFTGGVGGLPGAETIFVPARWKETLTPEQLLAALARRKELVRCGSRARGVLLALGWNALGFALAGRLSGDLTTVAGLTGAFLGATLWSFVGVLVLPTPSQKGVFEGDARLRESGVSRQTFESLLVSLDRDQDDEPSRVPGVERIFHPIPSVARRLASWDDGGLAGSGAWHAARVALYLSWASGGFLSRAVHCNAGRPDAWVFLPSD